MKNTSNLHRVEIIIKALERGMVIGIPSIEQPFKILVGFYSGSEEDGFLVGQVHDHPHLCKEIRLIPLNERIKWVEDNRENIHVKSDIDLNIFLHCIELIDDVYYSLIEEWSKKILIEE